MDSDVVNERRMARSLYSLQNNHQLRLFKRSSSPKLGKLGTSSLTHTGEMARQELLEALRKLMDTLGRTEALFSTVPNQDPTQKEQEDSRSYREEKREEKESHPNSVRDTIRRATWRLFKRDSGTVRSVDSVVENVDLGSKTSDSSKTLPKDVADAVQRATWRLFKRDSDSEIPTQDQSSSKNSKNYDPKDKQNVVPIDQFWKRRLFKEDTTRSKKAIDPGTMMRLWRAARYHQRQLLHRAMNFMPMKRAALYPNANPSYPAHPLLHLPNPTPLYPTQTGWNTHLKSPLLNYNWG